jgi:hypothetical protein
MAPIIFGVAIILIAFSNFVRGVPAQCCRLVPRMSWEDRRNSTVQAPEEDEKTSKRNPA